MALLFSHGLMSPTGDEETHPVFARNGENTPLSGHNADCAALGCNGMPAFEHS